MFNQYTSLIVKVLKGQNLFTESNLGDWFSSYVQFYSGGHYQGYKITTQQATAT